MKLSGNILKLGCSAILVLVVLFPFIYLWGRGEYDLGQVYVPQRFNEANFNVVDTGKTIVIQSIVLEASNWAGFDLQTEKCQVPAGPIEVYDGKNSYITEARLKQSLLDNKCDVLNFRFEPIRNSKGQKFYIKFAKIQKVELRYSKDDFYSGGELTLDGEVQIGDLNLVPVYKAGNLAGIIFDRIGFAGFALFLAVAVFLGLFAFQINDCGRKQTKDKNSKKRIE
ncbi:MAG: hypothetical protein ABIE03_00470 [Patescibacteria group bacterium]|nr:hypothetical protein [Patescibacteria group bacterium]